MGLMANKHIKPVPEADEIQHDGEYMTRAELRRGGRAVRPVDAATLIIVRRTEAEPQVLLGRRSSKHRFMPNKFVFPGGRVDVGDSRLRPPADLRPEVLERLRQGCSENKARALAMAALRETYEETGLLLGEPDSPTLRSRSPAWREYLRHDINPRLDNLHYVGRAITPPYRNRRFDARFFMIVDPEPNRDIFERANGSDELLELQWLSFAEAKQLQLPHITRLIIDEVASRLRGPMRYSDPGPFVYSRHGRIVMEPQ